MNHYSLTFFVALLALAVASPWCARAGLGLVHTDNPGIVLPFGAFWWLVALCGLFGLAWLLNAVSFEIGAVAVTIIGGIVTFAPPAILGAIWFFWARHG